MKLTHFIFSLIEGIDYHDTLNPAIWDNERLKSEVRTALLRIADKFVDFIKLPDSVPIEYRVLTGSNANYSYSNHSDLDLHIIIDTPSEIKDFLNSRKALWSLTHHPTIYQYPVECYVQDSKEEFIGSGIYDITNYKWIHHPDYVTDLHIDQYAVEVKAKDFMNQIDSVISSGADDAVVDDLKKKIRDFRKTGLESGGEFSVENVTFKELRNNGYLEKLANYERELDDKELSL
jgi:hypothetical protein